MSLTNPPIVQPARALLFTGLCCLAVSLLCLWFMTRQPWLGLRLGLSASGDEVIVLTVASHHISIPEGAIVQNIQGRNGVQLALQPMDLREEPDLYDTYAEMDTFFARQAKLDAILRSGEVRLRWRAKSDEAGETVVMPKQRPLHDLPLAFWLQLGTGFAGLLIAVWVYLLRPGDWGTRMFALTGLALPLSTTSAAIYSSRELALPEALFRQLSMLNHFGATAFGMALVALFLCYPRLLVRPVMLWFIPSVFGVWFLADVFRWAPDSNWGFRIPLILELLLAIAGGFYQWYKSQGRPLERASLHWLMLSALLGCSLFIGLVVTQSALGTAPLITQGYAFGFFLLMYVGIALGLKRYRLFDLDVWAYRVLLWVGGALLVIALDVALIAFGLSKGVSLGVVLLIAGWLYFPLRQWLWRHLVRGREVRLESLLPQVSELVFIPEGEAREAHWDAMLRRLYDPLEIKIDTTPCGQPAVQEEGLALCLPPLTGIQGRILRFAQAGRGLFSSRDAAFAASLVHLADQVLMGRAGYERGAQQERQRLARDLHDNIGARLLRLIHHLRGTPDAELAREAMKDLRAAIAAIDGHPVPLQDALADWRAEINARCDAAHVRLQWRQDDLPQIVLPPRIGANLSSLMREAVTNAIKHAVPTRMEIRIAVDGAVLTLTVTNDGCFSDPSKWQEGYGLRSMRGRLHDLGGTLSLDANGGEVKLCMTIPLPGLSR